jgi:hypothetical protein
MSYLPPDTAEEDLPVALQSLFGLPNLPRYFSRNKAKKRRVLLFDIGKGESVFARYETTGVVCWKVNGSAARISIFNGMKILPGVAEKPLCLTVVAMHKTKRDADGKPVMIGVLGHVVEKREGFRFIPMVSGRVSSRKSWPDAAACIPSWVHKMVHVRVYDQHELARAEAAAKVAA